MKGYVKEQIITKSKFVGIKLYKREYVFVKDRLRFVKVFDGEKNIYRLCRIFINRNNNEVFCDIFDGEEITQPNYEIIDVKLFTEVFDEQELLMKGNVLTNEDISDKIKMLNENALTM